MKLVERELLATLVTMVAATGFGKWKFETKNLEQQTPVWQVCKDVREEKNALYLAGL